MASQNGFPSTQQVSNYPSEGQILAGPGKFDLMCALFEGKVVTMTFQEWGELKVRITRVQLEDDSYQSWRIDGDAKTIRYGSILFCGVYHSRNRRGHFVMSGCLI